MVKRVDLTKSAQKDLRACPTQVQKKFRAWVAAVELVGVEEVRKTPGYHDEPLAGDRVNQRSIRLNQDYRAFYKVLKDGTVELLSVIEINKHKY